MAARKERSIRNEFLSLSVDARGRVVSLRNRQTNTELITHPGVTEPWRIIIPTGRHTLAFALGSEQSPKAIKVRRDEDGQSIVLAYDELKAQGRRFRVRTEFTLSLKDGAKEVSGSVRIENRSECPVDEIEFPVIGGLGGFPADGGKRARNMVWSVGVLGDFREEILHKGLPNTGRECDHYGREFETAMVQHNVRLGAWADFWSEKQGIYFGYHSRGPERFVFKVEKYPKEVPHAPGHAWPAGTPRWVRVHGIHVPCIKPGSDWSSQPVTIMPHAGDWHAGADRYSAWRHETIKIAQPPAWMDNFVGWSEILGKTYLGEIYHDYKQLADAVVKDAKVTGLDFVFYYGHSKIGAEGADYDHDPAPDLGGDKGFQEMLSKLHRNGIRIMLLDHFHRWVNRETPEFKKYRLDRFAMLDKEGQPIIARWWKETVRSCCDLEGPTPEWAEMCPACEEWRGHFLRHIARMVELGVDGVELDTFAPSRCYNPKHPHEKGADLYEAKFELMREARARAKSLNPDFVLIGEHMIPEARKVLDGYYPNRHFSERGRIYMYLYPELWQQAALVGCYGYDQANKALQLGIGMETEIWGLRSTALAACPELARYMGEINRFKRRNGDVLIRGRFRDTVGADVKGEVFYSILEGANGAKALVLRNAGERPQKVRAAIRDLPEGRPLTLWRPFREEQSVRAQPVSLTLRPHEASVLLSR